MTEFQEMDTGLTGEAMLHGLLEMMLNADEDTVEIEASYKLGDRQVPVVFKVVLVSVDNQEVDTNG